MKIGLVLDDTLDTPDGVQQYVLTVGGWLTAQGHEVHYLVGQTARTDIAHLHSLSRNLKVRFNGNRMSMPLPASRQRLKKLLALEQFDILHVQVPYSPFMAGRLLHSAPQRTAIVGTFHILPYGRLERFANRLLAFMNRRSARRFTAMIAASKPAAEFAADCYGFKATVLPHPFDYAAFAVPASPDTDIRITYLARLVGRKGALWLLKAIALLEQRNRLPADVSIHIGGRGPLLMELQKYVTQTGLTNKVVFDGFIAEAGKAAYLAQADIAVFPSVSGESFGISLIEAMAAARGVVLVGDNPGYAAALQVPDQLLDPTNTEQFASKLEYWLQHADERKTAATKQRLIAANYDQVVICKQIEAVYKQALQTAGRS